MSVNFYFVIAEKHLNTLKIKNYKANFSNKYNTTVVANKNNINLKKTKVVVFLGVMCNL